MALAAWEKQEGNGYVALSVLASVSWQPQRHRLAVLLEPCSWVGVVSLWPARLGTPPVPPAAASLLASSWTAVWGSAGSLVPSAVYQQEARGKCEMTLTLVFSPTPLTLKVPQHVGLVRSERCGVLAEWPISIFSSFLLNVCQKTTVITHEQGKSPRSRSPEEPRFALGCPPRGCRPGLRSHL